MTYLASKIGVTNITPTPNPVLGSGTTTGIVTINGKKHTAYYFTSTGSMTLDKDCECPVLLIGGGGSGGWGGGYGSGNPNPWWGGGGGGGGYLKTSYFFPANVAVTVTVGGAGGNSSLGHSSITSSGTNQFLVASAGGAGGTQGAGGSGGSGGGSSLDYVGSTTGSGAGTGGTSTYNNQTSTNTPFQGLGNSPNAYYGSGPEGRQSSFTASVGSGNVLTCTAIASGKIVLGSLITSGANSLGYISSLGTGTGGAGTYYLMLRSNVSNIVPSTPSSGQARISFGTSCPLVVGSTVTLVDMPTAGYNGNWTVAASSNGSADITCSVTTALGSFTTQGTRPRLFGVPSWTISSGTMTTSGGQGATWYDGITRCVGGPNGTTYASQNGAPMAPAHPNAARGGGAGSPDAAAISPLSTEVGAGGGGGGAYYSGGGNIITRNYGVGGSGGIVIIAVPN